MRISFMENKTEGLQLHKTGNVFNGLQWGYIPVGWSKPFKIRIFSEIWAFIFIV